MSIHLNDAGATTGRIQRTSGHPGINSFTMMAWVRLDTDRNAVSGILTFGTTLGAAYFALFADTDGVTMAIWNGSTSSASGSALTVGTWVHLALVCDGTGAGNLRSYVNGVLDITHAGAALTATTMEWGNDLDNEPFDGQFAALKVFNAALTADQIKREMRTYVPQGPSHLWCPCFETGKINDLSGNDRHLSLVGANANSGLQPPIVFTPGNYGMIHRGVAVVTPPNEAFIELIDLPIIRDELIEAITV